MRRGWPATLPSCCLHHSELERRFLAICKRHGLPLPQTNLWIEGQEVDAYWPDARLAIEIDSIAFHHTRRAFHDDRRRDRALAGLGIQVLRVTSRDSRTMLASPASCSQSGSVRHRAPLTRAPPSQSVGA